MALNNLGLGFVFTAKDAASRTINRLGRNFQSMEGRATKSLGLIDSSARQLGVGLGIAAVGVLGLFVAFKLAGAAGEFEQGLARTAATMDIATDSAAALLMRTAALDAGMRTQFGPAETANALSIFAAQGFNAKEATTALTPSLRLAQAGMIGIEESTMAMTSALKVFSLDADQAGIVTDRLLKITTKTSLQAKDLQIALGTVGRGASLAKQSLSEMLIMMGLVKNTGVEASVAASSVSRALIEMAKKQKEFRALGVEVTDANGKFRALGDVILDSAAALDSKYTDAAKRAAMATKLFGRFGITAFTAVSEQITNGIKGASGEILKGAEAIQFLRQSMEDAKGTAAEFEAKILATFPGQLRLLKGLFQTLAVVIGEPLARAFKPFILAIRTGVETVVRFIESIPKPIKDLVGGIAVGVLALVSAFGLLLAMKGALILFGVGIAFVGTQILSIMAPILLMTGALAVVGLVIAALVANTQRGKGSFITILKSMFEQGKLIFEGLAQYMEEGKLSGAIEEELDKVKNIVAKTFLGKIIDTFVRLQAMWDGVVTGFKQTIEDNQPVFDSLAASFFALAENLGFVTNSFDHSKGPMDSFMTRGIVIGESLAKAALAIVVAITLVIDVINIVKGIMDSFGITVGDLVLGFIAWKAVMGTIGLIKFVLGITRAIASLGLLKKAQMAYIAAQKLMNTSMLAGSIQLETSGINSAKFGRRLSGLTKGVGLLGVAMLGFAAGQWLDEYFGISDKISEGMAVWTGLIDEQRQLDQASGGRRETRDNENKTLGALSPAARLSAELVTKRARDKAVELGILHAIAVPLGELSSAMRIIADRENLSRRNEDVGRGIVRVDSSTILKPVGEVEGIGSGSDISENLRAAIDKNSDAADRFIGAAKNLRENPPPMVVLLDGELVGRAIKRGQRSTDAGNFVDVTSEAPA